MKGIISIYVESDSLPTWLIAQNLYTTLQMTGVQAAVSYTEIAEEAPAELQQ